MNIHVLSLDDWKVMSKNAHSLCFEDEQDPSILTCSYVLFLTDKSDTPAGYATVIEINTLSAYLQHGGAMPHLRGTSGAAVAYKTTIDFVKQKYEKLSTKIRNDNIRMLRLAMSEGFRICGVESTDGETYVLLSWGRDVQLS